MGGWKYPFSAKNAHLRAHIISYLIYPPPAASLLPRHPHHRLDLARIIVSSYHVYIYAP